MFDGTDWKPASLNVYDGERWKPAELNTASAVWPARDEIPVGARERHGRDLFYDEHVAHKELLSPLRVAQTFIEAV